jgi:hypothetical protein
MCLSIAIGVSGNPSTGLPHVLLAPLTGRTAAEACALIPALRGVGSATTTRNDRHRRSVRPGPAGTGSCDASTQCRRRPINGTREGHAAQRSRPSQATCRPRVRVERRARRFLRSRGGKRMIRPPILGRDATTSVIAPSYCSAWSRSWRRRSASAQSSASITCFQILSEFQWVRWTS